MPQVLRSFRRTKRFVPVFGVLIIAQAISGCASNSKSQNGTSQGNADFVTGSLGTGNSLLQQSDEWAAKWQKNPADPVISIGYARSLRAAGSNKKAVQILQQASLKSPKNQAVIAEYGKALSTIGELKQALFNLNRAQTLGSPDWRIYSAQGITLDKMEQFSRAREYYKSALNLRPNQPSVLNNIGLSYALDGDLANAEKYLRLAAKTNGAQPKVQRNLALVLGLNGKFKQSAKASNKVLSSNDTAVNIAYLKSMLSQPGTWQELSSKTKVAQSSTGKVKKRNVSKPRKITTLETTKVSTIKKPKKATRLKVSAKKGPGTPKSIRPASSKRLSAFSQKIEKALAVEQKTALIDPSQLRAN